MSEKGFTLIESLVALALGAMVVSAVLSTVRVAASGAQKAARVTDATEAFARAGAVLAGDAGHAVWLPDGAGRPLFLGLAAAMDLAQLPRGDRMAPVVVQYRLTADGAGTILTRTEAAAPVEIWRSDTALEFRFLDANGSWVADWPRDAGLPRAFALSDPAREGALLTAALPDLLPAACALGPGPSCPLPSEEFQ